jgi:L-ascorbate metabolism protein UlaG (beta-lactamase superfamily)
LCAVHPYENCINIPVVRPESIAWRDDALGGRQGRDGVRVRWLGTAGFSIHHDDHVLLIDPYVTRASLAACLVAPLRPDVAAIRRYIERADAIALGHTHFDHALDVPEIARQTGAQVLGSRSAAALCMSQGMSAERVDVIEGNAGTDAAVRREVGPFALRFVPSAHSRLLFGRVPFAGDISDCHQLPVRAEAYRCGAVFGIEIRVGGRIIYHMGSAELVDDHLDARGVDLLLLCVAGWTASPNLPERIVKRLAPRAVLLSHWDNFLRPLDRPARPIPTIGLPRLVERLSRANADLTVGTLPLLGDVWA